MKMDYREVKFLMDCSWFGWDANNHLPTASDEVCAEIEKVKVQEYYF
jgi:hypothetical protein